MSDECLVDSECHGLNGTLCVEYTASGERRILPTHWVDETWTPITGCYGPSGSKDRPMPCWYCFARMLAREHGRTPTERAFAPTLRSDLFDVPRCIKAPSRIFTAQTGDMWGPWVNEGWIREVASIVFANKQHTFVFRTRFPERYGEIFKAHPDCKNVELGTTITSADEMEKSSPIMADLAARHGVATHLALEPFIVSAKHVKFSDWIPDLVVVGPMTCGVGHDNLSSGEQMGMIFNECFAHPSTKIIVKERALLESEEE